VVLELGPARESIFPGENQLRIGEREAFCRGGARMMRLKARHRRGVIGAVAFQKLLRLFAELLQ
jgi:hypothetical protein